jgi:hypothetical protein
MSGSTRIINQKGQLGSIYIDDTAAHTGTFDALQALEATVVAALTGNMTDFTAGMPIPAGSIVYGVFTSVTLTSGKIVAYNKA